MIKLIAPRRAKGAKKELSQRTRRREERAALASIKDPARDFGLCYLPKYDTFLFIIPAPNGGYSSSAFNSAAAQRVLEFIAGNLSFEMARPALQSVISREWSNDQGTIAQQAITIRRLEDEATLLRWRIMLLEQEARRRVPAYSDLTALVLKREMRRICGPIEVLARATEREMPFRDDRGALRVGLVDDEKGWAAPIGAEKGAAS
jgi:hypothetical protein